MQKSSTKYYQIEFNNAPQVYMANSMLRNQPMFLVFQYAFSKNHMTI